jgi:hypothetical protein
MIDGNCSTDEAGAHVKDREITMWWLNEKLCSLRKDRCGNSSAIIYDVLDLIGELRGGERHGSSV